MIYINVISDQEYDSKSNTTQQFLKFSKLVNKLNFSCSKNHWNFFLKLKPSQNFPGNENFQHQVNFARFQLHNLLNYGFFERRLDSNNKSGLHDAMQKPIC